MARNIRTPYPVSKIAVLLGNSLELVRIVHKVRRQPGIHSTGWWSSLRSWCRQEPPVWRYFCRNLILRLGRKLHRIVTEKVSPCGVRAV
jgi:hypothetical protein